MNTMSRNVEKRCLSGEADHCSHVLGYCINHRAILCQWVVDGENRFFSCSFFRSKERSECKFRKTEVAGSL